MVKVAIKSEKLSPFGGIFSIMEQFDSNANPRHFVITACGRKFTA